jgi:glycosyltransferase involved in cell wall biosynthesis
MKLLWVNANFLHPTTKGGQIRTLEMIRRLNQRHEVHYAAFEDPSQPEGVERSNEYCTKVYSVRRKLPSRGSMAFLAQVASGALSSVPVAVKRFYSEEMRQLLEKLLKTERFDRAICDFLVSTIHFPHLERAVLFQHNVETMIWRRHAEHAKDPMRRFFFTLQAERMAHYEAEACRRAGQVVAVSRVDAGVMKDLFGITNVSDITTGVDLDYFAPTDADPPKHDLVFIGSMDWMPNVDGVLYFVNEILPLIRRERPACSLAIVGRDPAPEIMTLAQNDAHITVTGTVRDVRPFLWGGGVSIVPLRIGGGTRLKIYESMAAKTPIVSTAIGAEGLVYHDGGDILIANTPESFSGACLALLSNEVRREAIIANAWEMVASHFSWEQVTKQFEDILKRAPRAADS